MSARYGSRTRSGEAVSGFGQRAGAGGGAWVLTEQEFTAPGTWTCPPTVTRVEVIVVGGGGGGGASADNNLTGGGGGGGGVRTAVVPVSGPVPVTVGSGGTGATYSPAVSATPGGVSSFGSLGPGPVPAIPTTTVAVGGGGAGSSYMPSELSLIPTGTYGPIGGGAGGIGGNYYPNFSRGNRGGRYGYACASYSVPIPAGIQPVGAGGAGDTNLGYMGGEGKLGFGYGAPSARNAFRLESQGGIPVTVMPAPGTPTGWEISGALAGVANTGNGGGAGSYVPPAVPSPVAVPLQPSILPGAPGGSGIVIVRYWSAP